MESKKVKRKLKLQGVFIILGLGLVIVLIGYYILTIPINNIVVNDQGILPTDEVIASLNLKDNASFLLTTTHAIKKNVLKNPLVHEVTVKKNLKGRIEIDIEEEKVLFYNSGTAKYVLANNKEVARSEVLGVPTLINYTPSDIAKDLNKKLSAIDENIIALISEIEYSPDIKNGITIDENRFILRMNDGNRIFINIANFQKLNSYQKLYNTIGESVKGTFYLDGNRPRILFRIFEAENKSQAVPGDVLPDASVSPEVAPEAMPDTTASGGGENELPQ